MTPRHQRWWRVAEPGATDLHKGDTSHFLFILVARLRTTLDASASRFLILLLRDRS